MKSIKCFFCEKPAVSQRKNLERRINGKNITLSDAPVYYCADCNETFLSKEVQDAFRYIKENGLENNSVSFRFYEILRKIKGTEKSLKDTSKDAAVAKKK
jgi:YgiT-type zinc finger domain-containing protein